MAAVRLQRRLAAIMSADVVGYSRLMGAKRHMHRQQTALLFDHFVGAGEQQFWNSDVERSRCFQVHNQFYFHRQLHGKVCRSLASENLDDVIRRRAAHLAVGDAI